MLNASQRLHRRELGEDLLDPMISKDHREFETFAVAFPSLHHTAAKVLMHYLRTYSIGLSCCWHGFEGGRRRRLG